MMHGSIALDFDNIIKKVVFEWFPPQKLQMAH